jgi:nitrogen fixation-related uncharacterized protein
VKRQSLNTETGAFKEQRSVQRFKFASRTVLSRGVPLAFVLGSSAFADHIPPVGLDYQGTWVVLIAVGVITALLILSLLWAYLDGQFTNPERIKFEIAQPDNDWPFGRGTSLERPEPEKQ